MSLQSGHKLAHYEILESVGKGGMGEVYRAKDSKLGRDVAIKVLPEEFAENEERLARFKREAKVLASLNHPNIAAIHGLGESEGIHYLVLELVPGETLAERISRGPIPVEEAIAIAAQIAEALEEAHEQGIVHRDLKPANIKQTEDGKIKVLDYGLAKAFVEDGAEGDAATSMSPTLTRLRQGSGGQARDATRAGVILGTAAYMSPEQAKGKKVDKRADVWAFGVVLYEMLTGKRAFDGEDVSDTLAYVLTKEPEWDALPSDLSPTLRTYLCRCLEKDMKRRVRDIGDVRLAMDGAFDTAAGSSEGGVEPPTRLPGMRPSMGIALAAALALGVLTGAAVWVLKPEAPRGVTRFVVTTPSEPPDLLSPDAVDMAVSPDGTRIVYRRVGGNGLLVRAVDELEPTPLEGLGVPYAPFVSPDGNWVGYFDGDTLALRKVSILGGPPVTLCETAGILRGASWGSDDTIIFSTNRSNGLWRVAAGGGEPEQLTTDEGEEVHLWPETLPGGGAVLFTIVEPSGVNNIAVVSLESGATTIVVPGGSNARYASSGHIVYGVSGTLRAVGFDLDRLEVTSDPVPVLGGVITMIGGATNFGLSRSGALVYATGPQSRDVERTLVWVDRDGSEEAISAEPRAYSYPRISPDGTRVALDVRDQENDIWIWDIARATSTRLTFGPGSEIYPTWTPDGLRVALGSTGNPNRLWLKAADGTGTEELLAESTNGLLPQTFSPDGTQLVLVELTAAGFDISVRSMDGDGTITPLLATEFNEVNAELSPNGEWLAYQSNASGQNEIYVRPFPDVEGGRWQISRGGGTKPLWGPDGRELFYLSIDGQLTGVPTQTGSSFTAGNPEAVFDRTYLGSGSVAGGISLGRTYDISPDGKRFLMIKEGRSEEADPTQLVLVQNWFEELKRLVPTGN